MERAADDTFMLAMRYWEDAMMIRRAAAHFSDEDFRTRREAEAEAFSKTAYRLAMAGVDAPAADR
jgi:hypothetical protein